MRWTPGRPGRRDDGFYVVRIPRGWYRFWLFLAFPSPSYALLLGAIVTGDPDGRVRLFWIGLITAGILVPLGAGVYRALSERERYPDGVVAAVGDAGVRLGGPAELIPWARIGELIVCRLYDHSGETPALSWFLVVVERGCSSAAKRDRDPRAWGVSRELPRRVEVKAFAAAVAHHSRATVRYLGTVDNVRADLPVGSASADAVARSS